MKGLSLIILPKRIEERLREESKRVGVPEEELVVEALSKALNDPSTQRRSSRCAQGSLRST
jgi:predicted DNA-binding protein